MLLYIMCSGDVREVDDSSENGGNERPRHVLIPGRFCLYR